jgi:hypothetical protein
MELTLLFASGSTGPTVAVRCDTGSKLVRVESSALAAVQVEFSSDGSTWIVGGIIRLTGSERTYNFDNGLIYVRLNVLKNSGTVTASIAGVQPQRQIAVTNGATATGNSQRTAYVLTTDISFFTTVDASTGAILPTPPACLRSGFFNHGAKHCRCTRTSAAV